MNYGRGTSELIRRLYGEGVTSMFVIMRHGDRHYDMENPGAENFMGLTEAGKADALTFGRSLPPEPAYRFFSSSIGRCIETAYQIEKGCMENGARTRVNKLLGQLTGFFSGGPGALVKMQAIGFEAFFEAWFGKTLDEDVMANAENAGRKTVEMVRKKLADSDNVINIGASHDWNLYLLRHTLLGQTIAECGKVEYLHGLVIFERDGVLHGATEFGGPKPLLLGATG